MRQPLGRRLAPTRCARFPVVIHPSLRTRDRYIASPLGSRLPETPPAITRAFPAWPAVRRYRETSCVWTCLSREYVTHTAHGSDKITGRFELPPQMTDVEVK